MATVEKRRGGFRLVFWYQSQRFQGAVKVNTQREADQAKARVERNLQLLQEGRIEYDPFKDDLFQLMLSDGRLNTKPEAAKRITLGEFFGQYQANRPPGKESNTTYTENIHIKHLLRVLGENTPLGEIPTKAQAYATARHAEKSRAGTTISHVSIKKELGTLSSLWNQWGINEGLVAVPLSFKRVQYPKRKEQPKFQTWDEVMRKSKGDVDSELWESVYLSAAEVEELLACIRDGKSLVRGYPKHYPFVYPMFAFVAYTGCRRSEMLRAKIADIDFERNELTIREKKKDKTKEETYRTVPMTTTLKAILQAWLAIHPGGEVLFCRKAGEALTVQMASHHFRWAVEGMKWKPLPGFHTLRHSLVSNLASRGISDHVIMGLVGHLNRETTRRYLHLRPQTLEAALDLVFGK